MRVDKNRESDLVEIIRISVAQIALELLISRAIC
jgi:hypothetical protein